MRSARRRLPHSPRLFTTIALAAAAGLFAALFLGMRIPALWAGLVAVNTVELLLCGYDKLIAGSSAVRVPERLLHIVALLGGSPALLVGMSLFRHKTRKTRFKLYLLAVLLVQAALVAWWIRAFR